METMIYPYEVNTGNKLKKLAFLGLKSFGDSANSGAVDFVQWIAGDSDTSLTVDQPRPLTKPPTVNMLLQATKVAPGLMNGVWLMPPTPPVQSRNGRDNSGLQTMVSPDPFRLSTSPSFCLDDTTALPMDVASSPCDLPTEENSLSSDVMACSVDDSALSSGDWDNLHQGMISGDGAHNSGSSSPCLTFLADPQMSSGDARRWPQTYDGIAMEVSRTEDTFMLPRKIHFDQELPFQLNFYYSRRLLSAHSVCGAVGSTTTSSVDDETSPVSSTEEFDAAPTASASNEMFAKYIPMLKTCPPRVPKILLNKRNRNEWKDIQTAFLQSCTEGRPKKSRSDTSLSLANAMRKSSWKLKFRSGRFTKMSTPQLPDSDSLSTLKKKYPGRFDLAVNEKFCRLNACKRPDLTAVLYVQLPPGHERTLNVKLCHIKTELAVAAMLHFLYPYCQVQCLWVQSLQDNLDEFLRDARIKPKFSRFVYLRHFDAVLVLSEDAADLLRHTDTCFVRALAIAIGVSVDHLLVLVRQSTPLASESFD